jgi:hypothetical protein
MNPIYVVAEPKRLAHRTLVRLASRFLRASYLGLLSVLISIAPRVALAQTPRTFGDLANLFVSLLDSATGALIVVGILIYFYGISTSIMKTGNEDREKFRTYIVWGLLVLFIMVSIWGILALLQNTLFGNSSTNPATGSSASTPQFQVPQISE